MPSFLCKTKKEPVRPDAAKSSDSNVGKKPASKSNGPNNKSTAESVSSLNDVPVPPLPLPIMVPSMTSGGATANHETVAHLYELPDDLNAQMYKESPSDNCQLGRYCDEMLPLYTSYDLEKAAAILMQETLDMEEMQLHHESTQSEFYADTHTKMSNPATANNSIAFGSVDFENTYRDIYQDDFLYESYQPEMPCSSSYTSPMFSFQSTVGSKMMPLPPISTMKNKHNLLSHHSNAHQLFPTNVL